LLVVSNTSPIIALYSIEKLYLLKDIFGEIVIPQGVSKELARWKARIVRDESWIKERRVKNRLALDILTLFLDQGEAEAIILAREISADRLIIDERAGRDIARWLGIKMIGTLGILLLAKEEGLIPQVKDSLDALKKKNFWISKELEVQILKRAREIK